MNAVVQTQAGAQSGDTQRTLGVCAPIPDNPPLTAKQLARMRPARDGWQSRINAALMKAIGGKRR
jgi:hypothetical protein